MRIGLKMKFIIQNLSQILIFVCCQWPKDLVITYSGHFVNLLCYMKSKHFSGMFIKIKLVV